MKSNAIRIAAAAALFHAPVLAGSHLDPDLPDYKPVSGVSGTLNSVGSDTLNNLMTLWAEGFKKHYPNVKLQIEGKGSSTAPPALIEGTAQLGPMSRPMKSGEIDAFEKKFGYKPTPVRVAIDALAVFAHKDNPLKGITMKQIDAAFSSTRLGSRPLSPSTRPIFNPGLLESRARTSSPGPSKAKPRTSKPQATFPMDPGAKALHSSVRFNGASDGGGVALSKGRPLSAN